MSGLAPFLAFLLTNQGIADIGFAGNQIIILQDIERSDFQLTFINVALQFIPIFRTDFQIIIQDNGLPV